MKSACREVPSAFSVTDSDRGTCGAGLDQHLAGPAGATGPAGPTGATGAAGVSGYEVRSAAVANGNIVTASCNGTKKVMGGGFIDGNNVTKSYPNGTHNGWVVETSNNTAITAYAICATFD